MGSYDDPTVSSTVGVISLSALWATPCPTPTIRTFTASCKSPVQRASVPAVCLPPVHGILAIFPATAVSTALSVTFRTDFSTAYFAAQLDFAIVPNGIARPRVSIERQVRRCRNWQTSYRRSFEPLAGAGDRRKGNRLQCLQGLELCERVSA